jgi:hypothetical protein
MLDYVFNTVTFKPFILLLKEEFEESIFKCNCFFLYEISYVFVFKGIV